MKLDDVHNLLVQSQLLTAEDAEQQLAQWRLKQGWESEEDVLGFVKSLVEQQLLSDFQARAVLAGIPGPYVLGPYRVLAKVAAGRLGTIFRAEQVEFHQPVSLKIFSSALNGNPDLAFRLGREARVALQLEHPHVVRTYEIGKAGETTYIALEDLQGETLETLLQREVKLTFEEACKMIAQAARALQYIHDLEIVHRDIRPANLWVTEEGNIKLLEFGAARDALAYLDTLETEVTSEEHSESGETVLGSYDYMSPEQGRDAHTADARSDIYGLGCTFYHCLTGKLPFPDKNPVRQMLRHASEAPKPVTDFSPDVPQAVLDVLGAMLAKDPAQRYQRAEDAAWALEQIVPPEEVMRALDINPDFLAWTRSAEGRQTMHTGTDFAQPELLQFLNQVSTQPADDDFAPPQINLG